jgi:predicted transcriptional regulator
MIKKKQKTSVAERIMKIVDKHPKTAEEIRQELKDRFGYPVKPEDVRINLLYLLRREKIKRKKENKIYKYHI